ncbi:MAG: hypothetical protein M3305_02875 [Actinomycetota bacterium]|nr:hypothetical protein [Actinomycetota bacterium]
MKDNVTGKLYYLFTGEERFRLYIEALCRGDEAEARRLIENCPRETCSMNHAAYADRCSASREIVAMLCSALTRPLARLEMLGAFRKTLPCVFDVSITGAFSAYLEGHQAGSRRAWEAAGMAGDPPGWRGQEEYEMDRELESLRSMTGSLEEVSEVFLDELEELERSLLREALTAWEAFAGFCTEELGLEPEKLVKVWSEPTLSEIEKLKNMPDPPEVDQERLEGYVAALKWLWSRSAELV